jgi:uncharacterized protein (DUF4415 family)
MKKESIIGTAEAWEDGVLGRDEQYAQKASPAQEQEVEDALAMQAISIRLDKALIDTFKTIATINGVGYQPLMRDALRRFADSEIKMILAKVAAKQEAKGDRKSRALAEERKAA